MGAAWPGKGVSLVAAFTMKARLSAGGGGWGLEERGALRRMAKVGNSSGRRGQNLLVRNTRNCQAVLMAQLPLRVRTWGDPLSLGGTI